MVSVPVIRAKEIHICITVVILVQRVIDYEKKEQIDEVFVCNGVFQGLVVNLSVLKSIT